MCADTDSETPGAGTRGFTLLETLVAFTMLALVLSAFYGAAFSGVRAVGAGADRLEALARAEAALARVRAGLSGPEAPAEGLSETRDGPWRERVSILPFAESGAAFWRIEAEIGWTSAGVERSLSLATLAPASDRGPAR